MPLLHPNMAELYRNKVADLHRALLDDASRPEAVEILRSLVDAIVLTPADGQLVITLRGDLAGILSLGRRNKKPGSTAGTGLDQETQVVGREERTMDCLD